MKGQLLEQKIFKLIDEIAGWYMDSHNCNRHSDEIACGNIIGGGAKKEIEKRRNDLAFSLSEVI